MADLGVFALRQSAQMRAVSKTRIAQAFRRHDRVHTHCALMERARFALATAAVYAGAPSGSAAVGHRVRKVSTLFEQRAGDFQPRCDRARGLGCSLGSFLCRWFRALGGSPGRFPGWFP